MSWWTLRPLSVTSSRRKTLTLLLNRSASHYEVLKIKKTANQGEIKVAYLGLCKEFHPDVSTDPEAELKFRYIDWNVLKVYLNSVSMRS